MELTIPKWKRLTQPTSEPVSLLQAKQALNIGTGDGTHDERLTLLVQAAREKWERDTQRATTAGTFRQVFDAFADPLELLPLGVTSVSSITYFDANNATQTASASLYVFDDYDNVVRLAYEQEWPDTSARYDAVTVNFTAGTSDPLEVPAMAKAAMLSLVVYYFDKNPGDNDGLYDLRHYDDLVRQYMRSSYP
jgi:uncharacterized phiE125 gp8 family phage protein